MNSKGQTIVEFALVSLLLFTFIFAIVDFAVMFYVRLTMQHAIREGTRYAITGQGGPGGRKDALVQKIRENSCGLYEKNANQQTVPSVSVVTPRDKTYTNYSSIPDTGKPDQIISVSLNYSWPLLTPILRPFFTNGMYTFTVHATMKNEPWGL